MIDVQTEAFAKTIIDAGLKVHRSLGPGLLESAYEHCLAYEMTTRGLGVERQVALPISYEGVSIAAGYRLDLLGEDSMTVSYTHLDVYKRQGD